MQNIIEMIEVSFAYQDEPPIFNQLNLSIKKGETIGIVGSNGAGKSTLLKLLVGLVEKNKGTIKIAEKHLTSKSLQEIRKYVGYAFQDADAQLFMPTVYDDVAFGPMHMGLKGETLDKVVQSALKTVGAYHLKDRPPYKLSGGEKRSVTIATVLSMNPEIIILDEPTTGLDPKSRRGLIELLEDLSQTKIIATHDMELTRELCDRIIVMHEGSIAAQGPADEIFNDYKLLETCQLEQPYSMKPCSKCGL